MSESRKYLRFNRPERIEHWLFFISFTTLAITGLIQKFPDAGISQGTIALMGGIESVRIIHRIAATTMMLETIYHIGVIGYKVLVKRSRMSMLPTTQDARNAWQALQYNFGFGDERPQQGRYTFEEKAEYWAVVWGTVIMAVTGFMMWNPIATARFLPGEFIPAAKAAHGGEALLAVLAILIWHVYHVHLRHFNRSMFTGFLHEEEMVDEHSLELADIKAGLVADPPTETINRRLRWYVPSFGVAAIAMLVGVYLFVTVEETAIETIPPPEDVQVFVPLTPTPLPTALPTEPPSVAGVDSWESGAQQLLEERCGTCHNSSTSLGGLDLSSYQTAQAGGDNGPGFVPGQSGDSLIIIRQSTGDHPGQLGGDELSLLRAWIDAGALAE